MSAPARSVLLPVLLTATVAGAAGAQQASCDVNEASPKEITTAFFAVNQARQAQEAGRAEDAAKQLRAAVGALTKNPEKLNNPLGRQLLLGKALALWANQPGTPEAPTRASLGYASSPEATIDVVAAMDSAFTAVETAQPACVATTAPWRGGKPWITMVNAAVAQLNASQPDSAERTARRSLLLFRGAPYAHMVLGSLAQQKGQTADALAHYREAVQVAGGEEAYVEAKRGSLLTIAQIAGEVADSATAAGDKVKWAKESVAAYETLAKDFPESREGTQAQQRLPAMRLAAGDTAGVKASYAPMLATPDKYDDMQLLQAGIAAAQAGQPADAGRLFEATLKANPHSRDALFNAALMYNDANEHAKMIPLVNRLLALDPSNEESRMLLAHAYNGMVKGAKTKPAASAYRDSVGKYYKVAQELPQDVKVTTWNRRADGARLTGLVKNKGKAAKPFSLTIEFLDAAGTVVDTKTVAVADVAPNREGQFAAETSAAKVVAYRYKVGG